MTGTEQVPAVAEALAAVICAAVVGSVCPLEVNVVEVALKFHPAPDPLKSLGESVSGVLIDWLRPVRAVAACNDQVKAAFA